MSTEQRESRVARALVRIGLTLIAGVAVAILYIVLFVVARGDPDDLPLSLSLGYAALFTVPIGIALTGVGALGALIARLSTRTYRPLVVGVGSAIGGGLVIVLIAGTGVSIAGILYFAAVALGQAVVTELVVRRGSATE